MPTMSPAATAPQNEPTPPSTMTRKAGTTASTPMCGRMPQIGARMMPATAASIVPSTNTALRSFRKIDAERPHHLAVMGAGLDDRAVGRLLDQEPGQADDERGDRGGVEAIGGPDQVERDEAAGDAGRRRQHVVA